MLILIGTAPTAYALNHAVTKKQSQDFIAGSQPAASTLDKYVNPSAVIADSREDVTEFVRTREFMANTMLALRQLVHDRRGGLVRSSGQYNPCSFFRYRRDHGSQPHWTAMGNGSQSVHGMDTHLAGLDDVGGFFVLGIPKHFLAPFDILKVLPRRLGVLVPGNSY